MDDKIQARFQQMRWSQIHTLSEILKDVGGRDPRRPRSSLPGSDFTALRVCCLDSVLPLSSQRASSKETHYFLTLVHGSPLGTEHRPSKKPNCCPTEFYVRMIHGSSLNLLAIYRVNTLLLIFHVKYLIEILRG